MTQSDAPPLAVVGGDGSPNVARVAEFATDEMRLHDAPLRWSTSP